MLSPHNHALPPEEDQTPSSGGARTPTSKFWPLFFCALGVGGAALGIGWATLVWHSDPLVTPRGQVIITITTVGVMSLFIGVIAYWRASDRDRKLALHKEQMSEIAGLRAEVRALKAEVEEFRAESVADKARLRDDIISAIKGQREAVHEEHVELAKRQAGLRVMLEDMSGQLAGGGAGAVRDAAAMLARLSVELPSRIEEVAKAFYAKGWVAGAVDAESGDSGNILRFPHRTDEKSKKDPLP